VARIGGTFSLIALAIRNSFRRRARLVLTLLTLTAGGLFFMAALNVRSSMINTLDQMFAARKSDLTVSLARVYEVEKVQKAVSNTPGVSRAEGWFTTEASHDDLRLAIVALPPDTQLLEFDIIDGRKLTAGDTDAI